MIKIDKDSVTLEGKGNLLLSELTLAIHVVIDSASEHTGIPHNEILEQVTKHAQLYKLTDAGMTIKDAIETIGIDPGRVNLEESIIPDNMKAAFK